MQWHKYEVETKKEISNLKEEDKLISRRTKLTNSYMVGANNTSIRGDNSDALASQILNNLMK